MHVTILGSGGGAPSALRETSCVLLRDHGRALLLDAGSGVRRLLDDATLLDGVGELEVVLTHFHFDHVCGVPFLPRLGVVAAVWAPGAWLYDRASAEILEPLRRPPISANDDTSAYRVEELAAGAQVISGFAVRAVAQPRHWAPSAGLRIDDELALVTDTPYERTSAELAGGVAHLLHEAWSTSRSPRYPDRDATAADAARVARESEAGDLTLVHIDPPLDDLAGLLDDAVAGFELVALGEDGLTLG
jgi:ribonuclease BN (tRNA processing enzyme)